MKSYLETITEQAEAANVSLLKAFSRANIPRSTYYRTIKKDTELRVYTALRISHAIEQVRQIQDAVKNTKELRANGGNVERRSIKAKVKSRTMSL